jgi:uncharacterized membrane protein
MNVISIIVEVFFMDVKLCFIVVLVLILGSRIVIAWWPKLDLRMRIAEI